MELRQSLFWDVDPKNVDLEKNAEYVIERVLDFGHDEEVRWLRNFYDNALLKKVVLKSRSLRPETKNLWTLLLQKI
ncbi:MAG: hypothetical protein HYT43_02140 [Candidatus Taylorbacteria bacterium]|nr:hypothetical protein [Candidatus Taylorbacteria bacterium]